MKEHITPNLYKLAKLFKKKGDLFIVGGYVRNSILGIYDTDIDLASKLTPEEIKTILFGTKYEVKEKSKKLGTITISLGEEKWEHSTFRRETYAEGGEHVPLKVEFVSDIKEDAKRRDFTVNAIYYNILKDEFVDFYNGINDAKKKIIRTIEHPDFVFENDGLRILRMIRLASELGFKIDSVTLRSAYCFRENLNDISGSRKIEELNLILNSDQKYKISKKNSFMQALKVFNSLKLWKYYYSPVLRIKYDLVKNVQPKNRFIALLIDILTSARYKTDMIELTNQILGKHGLGIPENKIEYYKKIVFAYNDALGRMENKEYFIKYFDDFEVISDILRYRSKLLYMKYNFFYHYLINNKVPIRLKDLKIGGAEIKANYPKIKEKYYTTILTELLSRVFDGSIKNEKNELIAEIAKVRV